MLVENLFDLDNDPDKNDDEFSIGGRKNVTTEIYDLKLKNCGEVLQDLNADVLGICEVENRFMLEELNITKTEGGLIASWNFFGYLCGSLLSILPFFKKKVNLEDKSNKFNA